MISLRVVHPDDQDLIMQWENNPEFWPYSANSGPFTESEIAGFIEECMDLDRNGQCRYLIHAPDNLQPVGALDLFEFDPIQKTAGVGILIAEASNRRRGFARSALLQIATDIEIKKRIRLLWCIIHTDNVRSLQLFEGAGFKIQGEILYKEKKAFRLIRYTG